MEDSDEPYLDGIKYHAMPPLKRFRDMEHLSGGEKTMAALALLFAIHSYQPSPFFVLDEVDAALDNANVAKIANYIREHAGPGMQFIVISLKTGLFQGSEALVGIHRDQGANTSKALTLDVSPWHLLTVRKWKSDWSSCGSINKGATCLRSQRSISAAKWWGLPHIAIDPGPLNIWRMYVSPIPCLARNEANSI